MSDSCYYFERVCVKFFDYLKQKLKTENSEILIEELRTNSKSYQINFVQLDDLFMITTLKISTSLHHNINELDELLHYVETIIFDKNCELLVILPQNIQHNQHNQHNHYNHDLNDIEWKNVKIYNYYVGTYVVFFEHHTKLYVHTKQIFDKLENQTYLNHIYNLNKTEFDFSYGPVHTIIHSQKLKFILAYENLNTTLENKIRIIKAGLPLKNLTVLDKQIYFSCKDEIDFYIDEENEKAESNKKLTTAGVIIEYTKDNDVYIYNIKLPLYQKIMNLIYPNTNLTICYMDLYKSDNLNFMINYMTLYPNDIIKRINNSFKILSKEILNIYHLTRKKNHSDLYNVLNKEFKKILYDLHTIFINTRKEELYVDDDLGDKKSLTQDNVYRYIKKMPIELLISLYSERPQLIEQINKLNINTEIMFENCIHSKTITYFINLK